MSETHRWIVTRVWTVEARTAAEAIEASTLRPHHRVEALAASLCRHGFTTAWGVHQPDHITCPDCGVKLFA